MTIIKPSIPGYASLDAKTSDHGQGHNFKGHFKHIATGRILLVSIHHDSSYDFQSRASVKVWSDKKLKWRLVASLLFNEIGSSHEKSIRALLQQVDFIFPRESVDAG